MHPNTGSYHKCWLVCVHGRHWLQLWLQSSSLSHQQKQRHNQTSHLRRCQHHRFQQQTLPRCIPPPRYEPHVADSDTVAPPRLPLPQPQRGNTALSIQSSQPSRKQESGESAMPDCGAMALSIDSTGVGEHGGAQGHSGLLQYNVTASGHLAEDTYAFYQVRACHDLKLTIKLTPSSLSLSLSPRCVWRAMLATRC